MSVTDEIPERFFSVTTPDALGVELARAIVTRAEAPGDGVVGFASALSLDVDRLQVELRYLAIATTQFALEVALGAGESHARVVEAFERALWSVAPWQESAAGLGERTREYKDALNHPHPELGRAYVIGRAFARQCRSSHEVAVIEFGARAYMEQLPRLLALLRSVRLV